MAVRGRETDAVLREIHLDIIDELGDEGAADSRDHVALRIRRLLSDHEPQISPEDCEAVASDLLDDIFGFGPIQPLLEDESVTEVMVNGPEAVYVERDGRITKTDARFLDTAHLLRTIDRIVGHVGRRIDESSPMVDARLDDGSRVNAIIHPLAVDYPVLTIRKFSTTPFTAPDLIRLGTLNEHAATFLEKCVEGKMNILISGGTGTGKTSLLNVVSSFIPHNERVLTIEDAAELRLGQEHIIRLEARPANLEGKGQVTIRDLVRNALRMRPDRIIVGEVRGAEALDMLQAMNTGHEGSLSTIHANSPRDALSRLETMVLMAGFDLPVRAIREQMASSLDLIVQLARLRDGSRRVVSIAEVQSMEGDAVIMQDIFKFDFSQGWDEQGKTRGTLRATGIRPSLMERIEYAGLSLPAEVFSPAASWGR